MSNQKIQEQYKILIKDKNLIELARLIKKTGINPAEYSVRIGVKSYMSENRSLKTRIFSIIKLLELTSTNLDANIIQDICKLTLDLGNPYTLDFFMKKVEINNDIFGNIKGYIQKSYSTYINEGQLVELSKLMAITKMSPSEHSVLDAYKKFLNDGNIISFINLKKRTNVEPPQQIIIDTLQYYKNMTNDEKTSDTNDDSKNYWLNRIDKLSKITGVTLDKSNN